MNKYKILNSNEQNYDLEIQADRFEIENDNELVFYVGDERVAMFVKHSWSGVCKA